MSNNHRRGAQTGRWRRWRRWLRLAAERSRGERGSALTEFAIITLAVVPVIIWSLYFVDVLDVRLTAQEAARYATWEFTSYELVDAKLKPQFSNIQKSIEADVRKRFANLRSVNTDSPHKILSLKTYKMEGGPGNGLKIEDLKYEPGSKNFGNLPGPFAAVGRFIGSIINKAVGWALESAWKYNMKGEIKTTATFTVEAGIFPENWPFKGAKYLPPEASRIVVSSSHRMLVENWKAASFGSEIVPTGTNYGNNRYWEQSYAMFNLGVNRALVGMFPAGVMNALGKVSSVVAIPWQYHMATKPYRRTMSDGKRRIRADTGTVQANTSPMDIPKWSGTNPYVETFRKRGDHYLGCTQQEIKQNGSWVSRCYGP